MTLSILIPFDPHSLTACFVFPQIIANQIQIQMVAANVKYECAECADNNLTRNSIEHLMNQRSFPRDI